MTICSSVANPYQPRSGSPRFIRPKVTQGAKPSLFEFVEANTSEPLLSQRFHDAVHRLARESAKPAEMLVLIAYVHSCRTPISMDMIIAYWRDDSLHWRELYDLVAKAGRIVMEYEGFLADEEQDYFAAHSQYVAEAVLNAASPKLLKKLLTRLHDNVSPYRICHYDIFRRRAYESGLFERAFPEWDGRPRLV